MEIVVAGTARFSLPPDRATVHARVSFEAATKAEALTRATEQVNALGAALRELQRAEPSPISSTSVMPISTRQWHPYSDDGRVLPLRHVAEARARATFVEFRALAAYIDQWGAADGVTFDFMEWSLTDDNQAAQESAVLERAVASARQRAEAMARAAGFGAVRFVQLTDPGLLTAGGPSMGYDMAHASMKRDAGGGGVDVSPEDIDVAATVHARFTTD